MDAMHIVLAVAAIAGLGGVGWLLAQRTTLASRVAAAETSASAASQARAACALELEAERRRTSELDQRADAAEKEAAALGAQLEAIESSRIQERRDAETRLRDALEAEHRLREQELVAAKRQHAAELAVVDQARQQIELKLREFDARCKETFAALAGSALRDNREQFLSLAEQKLATKGAEAAADLDKRREAVDQLVKPIAESLRKTDEKLAAMEKERGAAYAQLTEQVRSVHQSGEMLRGETSRLVKALREPQVRGRYGEVQLKRVAELAGMRSYCDFVEQNFTVSTDGRALRPDMVVRLPNGRELVVDAKANLKPYLDAMEATDEQQADICLKRFADGVADQARKLAAKGYYAEYAGTPEFVVMFVPGDQFVDAALRMRPDLLETAASHNIILASPSSLIALLRAVAVGFREAKLAADAQALLEMGRSLHERARAAMEHIAGLGKALEQAVGKYNAFIGSYESRLAPTLKQFEEAGVKGAKELPEVSVVDTNVRGLFTPSATPDG